MHTLLLYAVRVIVIISTLFSSWELAQATIQIQGVTPVDVTPSGFSIIWQSSVPATPRLVIYADAAGTSEITSAFEVIPFPLRSGTPEITDLYTQEGNLLTLRSRVQSLGLMSIQVRGGSPSTTYYYHVYADGNGDSGQWPLGPPASVTTTVKNTFVASANQLLVTIDHPDPKGWIVTATSNETFFGISAIVGDGAASNQAHLNLSRMFGLNGFNWTPTGTKQMTLTVTSSWDTTTTQDFQFTFLTDFAVALVYAIQLSPQGRPSITLVEPARAQYTRGQSVLLGWVDTTVQANAHIALYYDTDLSGADGTLIASDLGAPGDASADTYVWNTTGLSDGVYYVYATLTDGSTSVTSYAPGAITIDRQGADTDGDAMSDAWEGHYFGSLSRNGTGDFDSDGSTDLSEYAAGTDPTAPDVRMSLRSGLNLIAVPIIFNPGHTSASLLAELGAAALSLSRINTATATIETTTLTTTEPHGTIFSILPGEGYYIEMAQDQDAYWAGLAAGSTTIDLSVGLNLVGFQPPLSGYKAFQLLQALGDAETVASIRHFNRDTGRYETAVYYNGQPSGVNFPIERSIAYFISVKRAISDFVIP